MEEKIVDTKNHQEENLENQFQTEPTNKKMQSSIESQLQSLFESSPVKVFPITRSAEELAEVINETPAKDDAATEEEGIFETPFLAKSTDNSKYKLHDVMIKTESKTKPKIISIESVVPKIKIHSTSNSQETLPKTKIPAEDNLSLKQQQQRIIVEKCAEEVNQAIESIIVGNNNVDQHLENSIQSITMSPINQANESLSESNKVELVKAIQSITQTIDDDQICEHSEDSESNLRLVLDEEEEKLPKKEELDEQSEDTTEIPSISHNTRSKSKLQNKSFNDNNSLETDYFSFVYNESEFPGKRKRVKHYSNEDLAATLVVPANDEYHYLIEVEATPIDMFYQKTPTRKKNINVAKKNNVKRKFILFNLT